MSLLCHTERRPSAPCGYRTLLTVVACRGSIIGQASNLALGVVMFPGVINTIFMSGMMVRGSVFFVRIDEPGLFNRKKRRVGRQESVR